MDDFRRIPKRNTATVATPTSTSLFTPTPTSTPTPTPTPTSTPTSTPTLQPQPLTSSSKKPRRRKILWALLALLAGFLVFLATATVWTYEQLTPVNANSTTQKDVTIKQGSTPKVIAKQLKDDDIIRSDTAFLLYTRIKGVQGKLQAGTYKLSPSQSVASIVEKLTSGDVDTFSVTFLPGATVADNKEVLEKLGYSSDEIETAFSKNYTSDLFSGKPASADLEGYIYGDTYTFTAGTSVEAILERTFSEFLTVVNNDNLVALYKEHGLSLYQGITLASIVQREASASGDDMARIAQVFYNRLASDMPLGSDVTYQYIADKTGVSRDPNLDSPYNTRLHAGLPPGPISTPGEKALKAVASPSGGDYLYFLSGDDDVTYFAKTLEEHEANIKSHCQVKCQIL